MLGVVAVTSFLIGVVVYLIRYNHQIDPRAVDTLLFCGQIVIGHVLGASASRLFSVIHVVPSLDSRKRSPRVSAIIEWSLTARATQPSRITLAEHYLQLTAAARHSLVSAHFRFARLPQSLLSCSCPDAVDCDSPGNPWCRCRGDGVQHMPTFGLWKVIVSPGASNYSRKS